MSILTVEFSLLLYMVLYTIAGLREITMNMSYLARLNISASPS